MIPSQYRRSYACIQISSFFFRFKSYPTWGVLKSSESEKKTFFLPAAAPRPTEGYRLLPPRFPLLLLRLVTSPDILGVGRISRIRREDHPAIFRCLPFLGRERGPFFSRRGGQMCPHLGSRNYPDLLALPRKPDFLP